MEGDHDADESLDLSRYLPLSRMSGAAIANNSQRRPNKPRNIKRTPLQKFDVPGTSYETVIGSPKSHPT
jgi:hypothetical protein